MRAAFEKVPGQPDASWHFHMRRAARFPFEWHYHDEAELTLIVSGTGRRFVGDCVSRYEPGDFVLVGANVPHTWRSDEDGEHAAVVCQFRPDCLGGGLLTAPEFAGVRRLLQAAAAGLSFGDDAAPEARRVRQMQGLDGPGRTLELLAVLNDLTHRRQSTLSVNPQLTSIDQAGRHRIEAVIAYIDHAHTGLTTLQEAAVIAAMTPSSLSRYFRVHTGRRFRDYVNDVRIAAASRRLAGTDEPITSVAAACGFQNIANFNRRFRERFGMSPRQYRAAFRAQS